MAAGRVLRAALAVGACCLACAGLPAVTFAADTDAPTGTCPDAPAVYSGTDDLILQVNAGRREAVDTCVLSAAWWSSLRAELDALRTSTQAHDDAQLIRDDLADLGVKLDTINGTLGESPTTDAGVTSALVDTREGIAAAVWFLAGLLAALLAATQLRGVFSA